MHSLGLKTCSARGLYQQGRIHDFHGGGGGGAEKIMCAHAHHEREERKGLITVGVQGGPGKLSEF